MNPDNVGVRFENQMARYHDWSAKNNQGQEKEKKFVPAKILCGNFSFFVLFRAEFAEMRNHFATLEWKEG